ncbi:MAG TPA: HNH endonuclease signature motif containing protein [Vicinamibacterales bacterium]|nr:HNH endonuclease signature motif containing protein [Vicinamibacterales bacterium]
MELDARRLYLAQGCSSLFTYCTQVLHLSEHAAYGRIEAARAARRFPRILELLTEGSLTLTSVGLLAPHLTAENQIALLESARRKSKRDVERLVAAIHPLPDVAASVRKLPQQPPAPAAMPLASRQTGPEPSNERPVEAIATRAADGGPGEALRPDSLPRKPAVLKPLAPERYKVQVTISREAHDHLRRAQELLRHVVPNGDPALVIERALAVLVEDLERKKLAAVRRPHRTAPPTASNSRHIPAAVRRAVWARDGGQCAFVGDAGRCSERGFLEVHHVFPHADGGVASVGNLQLRCRAHNAYEAEEWFGPWVAREPTAIYGDSVRTRPSGNLSSQAL